MRGNSVALRALATHRAGSQATQFLRGRGIVLANRFCHPDYSAISQTVADLVLDRAWDGADVELLASQFTAAPTK